MYKPWRLATVKACFFFCEGLLDNSRNMFNNSFDFGVNWYFINWDQKYRVWGSKLCFHDSFVLFHINLSKFAQYFCCSPQDTFVMKKEPGVSSTRCFFLMGEISKGTFTGEINLSCIAIEILTLSTGHICFFQTHSGIFEIAQELARWKVLNRPMAWLVDKLQPAWSVWLLTEDSPTPNPSVSEIGMGVYSIYTSGFPDLSGDEHPRYKLVLVLGC